MSVTELDPQTALIVVDVQVGTIANPAAHPTDEVVTRVAQLVGRFDRRQLPVVLATVTGTPTGRTQYGPGGRDFPAAWSQLVPELDSQPDAILIRRNTWSAFAGTDLDRRLRERGVTQVVLVGVATSFGVESTARQAYDLGYHVVIVSDAVTDPSLDAHTASMSRVFPALGQIGTTTELLALVDAY